MTTTNNALNAPFIRGSLNQILGSGSTRTFTILGITSSSTAIVTVYATTNAVYIIYTRSSADELTLIFNGDPGVYLQISYLIFI